MTRCPRLVLAGLLIASAAGCGDRSARRYPLHGQVVTVASSRREITIRHERIDGFMDAMTMPFSVRDVRELAGRQPGDVVTATLVIAGNDAYVENLRKVGAAAQRSAPAPPASVLQPGDAVSDAALVDQRGRPWELSRLRGRAIAVTFTYTRCPLPTACPALDRRFAAAQRALTGDPVLARLARLVTVTFDPDHDTPQVLAAHARTMGADPATWTFATGARVEVDRFAAQFGLTVVRDPGAAQGGIDITHNMRTAVIGPDGTLVRIFTGGDWKSEDLVQQLRELVAPLGT